MREQRPRNREGGRVSRVPRRHGDASHGDERDGLIFDVSAMGQMNVGDLSLLLTASRLAREDNLDVWVAGLPGQSWQVLEALGLADEFKQFPEEHEENPA